MRTTLIALLAATALGASAIAIANIKAPPNDFVHVGVNDKKNAETAKKVAIKRRAGQKQTTVVSLGARDLGPVRKGQKVRGMGEVEVSVTCTEPMPQCIGKIYKYSPHVRAQFVLSKSARSTKGERLGKPVTKQCGQSYPNRNHHCVLVLDRSAAAKRSCANCSLNIVLTAWHKKAKNNNILVIGADSDDGIKQGQASISAAVFQRNPGPASRVYRSKRIVNKTASVVDSQSNTKETVLASVRIDDLKKGDALLVSGTSSVSISGLGYNVLTQSQIIVSQKGRSSTSNKGVPVAAVSNNGNIATQAGYNCTQGPSDYRNPCPIYDVGAAYMEYSALREPMLEKGRPVPLYFNLVGSFGAQFGKPFHHGDKVRVRKAQIRVERIDAQ